MTVVSSHMDPEALTLTFVAEFDVGVDLAWQLWADPRRLERWWGPPGWPAIFTHHELVSGGQAHYHMTGPGGERTHGWWAVGECVAPNRLVFDDGFAEPDGTPNPELGTVRGTVTLEPLPSGCRMTAVSSFASGEQLDRMLGMGMEEGMRLAMGQMDEALVA